MSQGQLRQLQWIVPVPWAPELVRLLSDSPIAGAGVRVRWDGAETHGGTSDSERWVGFFDAARMVDEALRPAAHALSISHGLLPIAGCGRRGVALYLVAVGERDLPVWHLEGPTLQPLGVGLAAFWSSAKPEPGVQLRRRIPEKAPRRLAKTSGSGIRATARTTACRTTCERTLPLFA